MEYFCRFSRKIKPNQCWAAIKRKTVVTVKSDILIRSKNWATEREQTPSGRGPINLSNCQHSIWLQLEKEKCTISIEWMPETKYLHVYKIARTRCVLLHTDYQIEYMKCANKINTHRTHDDVTCSVCCLLIWWWKKGALENSYNCWIRKWNKVRYTWIVCDSFHFYFSIFV